VRLPGRKPTQLAVSRVYLAVVLVTAACGVSSGFISGTSQPDARAATPLIDDEFSGTAGAPPDPGKWIHETGGGGWGNNELECYTSSTSNAHLDGLGDLLIVARRAPGTVCTDGNVNNYTSARLDSRWSFQYGEIDVRAKMPTGQGIWPAFWAMGTNFPQVGWPSAGEMDFSEVIGKQPSIDHVAVHGPRGGGKTDYSILAQLDSGVDLSQAFHTYSAKWSSRSISFYFDGTLVRTINTSDVPGGSRWVFDHPFYKLLNVAVGGRWPGEPDSTTTWPQVMTIDYVRVYQ
jgi:beta-glucanase (GH16 family)